MSVANIVSAQSERSGNTRSSRIAIEYGSSPVAHPALHSRSRSVCSARRASMVVGAWVHSASKAGRDVGELCGVGTLGVRATNDVEEILAMAADCVLYSPLLPQLDEVVRLLESGKNVVTPVGWFYPFSTPGVAELEAACRRGGVSLHGTGIHPGGITELLPLTVSSLCRNVRHVRAEEFSDIRVYRAELVVREVMLFGKPPAEAQASPMVDLLGY